MFPIVVLSRMFEFDGELLARRVRPGDEVEGIEAELLFQVLGRHVDVARHAARAYARESAYTEDEALTRIVDMFEA